MSILPAACDKYTHYKICIHTALIIAVWYHESLDISNERRELENKIISHLNLDQITRSKVLTLIIQFLCFSELYGPLMVVLTLIAVMLAGMKAHGATVQVRADLLINCFGQWRYLTRISGYEIALVS